MNGLSSCLHRHTITFHIQALLLSDSKFQFFQVRFAYARLVKSKTLYYVNSDKFEFFSMLRKTHTHTLQPSSVNSVVEGIPGRSIMSAIGNCDPTAQS